MEVKFGFRLHLYEDFPILKNVVTKVEKLRFESIWVNDHLVPTSGYINQSFYESWTTLSALAMITKRIRLGTLVLCNDFRYPSILAKMASTLDIISNGRLLLGLGAGYYEPEYIMYGIPYQKLFTRIKRLEEAVQIVKKLWIEDNVTFEGKYYRIKETICNPKPVQKPYIPIVIGGSGKNLLKVVARFADESNFYSIPLNEVKEKLKILEYQCEKVGRDYREIRKSYCGDIIIAQTEKRLREIIAERASKRKLDYEAYQKWINASIIGTPKQIVERIRAYTELGVTNFILIFPKMTDLQCLRIFADEVMPFFT